MVRWTDRPAMFWDIKQQNKQNKIVSHMHESIHFDIFFLLFFIYLFIFLFFLGGGWGLGGDRITHVVSRDMSIFTNWPQQARLMLNKQTIQIYHVVQKWWAFALTDHNQLHWCSTNIPSKYTMLFTSMSIFTNWPQPARLMLNKHTIQIYHVVYE